MNRLIDILIISIILLGVAFCFGCKEKAEVERYLIYTDDPIYDIPIKSDEPEPNEPILPPDHQHALPYMLPEPNEPEITTPRYYHPFDPRAYTCPKCYEGASGNLCPGHYEPNEPNNP